MESRKEKIRKLLRIYLSVAFLLCVYATGILSTIRSKLVMISFNPIQVAKCIWDVGFAFPVFLVLFIIAGTISVMMIKRMMDKQEGSDSAHPTRILSDHSIYGTSLFEKPYQYRPLAQIRPIEDAVGIILGQLDEKGRECIDMYNDPNDYKAHNNKHMFALGASGSGKTFTLVKNYCYQSVKLGHSCVLTDPKGELYTDTADFFRQHGYVVRRLSFNNLEKSDGWDCMKTLRKETKVTNVELNTNLFATAIMSNIVDNPNSIYYTGPLLLLQALILRLVLDDTIPEEEKNIKKIYEWLTDPGGMTFLDTLFDSSILQGDLRSCLKAYTSFKGSGPNLQGNLKTNLAAGVQSLGTGLIADILSTDDIDLKLPGECPCAYFIQFPVPNTAYKFPIALFFTMLFQTLQSHALDFPGQKLPVEVDFILDEFAQCGIFPDWDKRISVIRSNGLNVCMIVQTLAQFISNYGTASDTIISNCATWLILGVNDSVSAEYISKRLGKTSVIVESEAREGFKKIVGVKNRLADRTTQGVGGSELLSPDEVQKIVANQLLIIFQRHNPIWANSVPHYLHPLSKGIKKTYDEDEPDLHDTEAKKKKREEENIFIAKYRQTHQPFVPPDNIDDAPYKEKDSFYSDVKTILKEDFTAARKRLFRKKKKPAAQTETSRKDSQTADQELIQEESVISEGTPAVDVKPPQEDPLILELDDGSDDFTEGLSPNNDNIEQAAREYEEPVSFGKEMSDDPLFGTDISDEERRQPRQDLRDKNSAYAENNHAQRTVENLADAHPEREKTPPAFTPPTPQKPPVPTPRTPQKPMISKSPADINKHLRSSPMMLKKGQDQKY